MFFTFPNIIKIFQLRFNVFNCGNTSERSYNCKRLGDIIVFENGIWMFTFTSAFELDGFL